MFTGLNINKNDKKIEIASLHSFFNYLTFSSSNFLSQPTYLKQTGQSIF